MQRHENIFFDSMIVNLAASGQDSAVETLLESQHVQCLLPFSVQSEASDPGSPAKVRAAVARFLYTLNTGPLTPPEREDMGRFISKNRGSALPQNIDGDLSHVWEAAKYGGRFFVTYDQRLLNRASAIHEYKGITLITPEQAVALYAAMISRDFCAV